MNEAAHAPAGDIAKTNHKAMIAMVLMLAIALLGGLAALLLFSK